MTDPDAQHPRRAVVVIGAGRSGTSLAMQVLAAQGMCISGQRKSSDTSNPMGDFEDQEITAIHAEIRDKLNIPALLPRDIGRREYKEISPLIEKIKTLVVKNVADCETVWGFKDPGASNLLPLWEGIFKELDIEPRFIVCVRNPGAVVSSMKAHFDRPESVSELLWLSRTSEAVIHGGSKAFLLHYEDWFLGHESAAKLGSELVRHASLSSSGIGDTVGELIKIELNRSPSSYIPENPLVLELYEKLRDLPSGVHSDDAVLNVAVRAKRISDYFQKSALSFGSEDNRVRNTTLRERLKDKSEKIKQKNIQIESLRRDLEILTLQNNEYLGNLKEAKDELEELRVRTISTFRTISESSYIAGRKNAGKSKKDKKVLRRIARFWKEYKKRLRRVLKHQAT